MFSWWCFVQHKSPEATLRAGMLQCVQAGGCGEALVLDQSKALKAELMMLNQLCDDGKKAVLFKNWDSSWNGNTIEDWDVHETMQMMNW